MTITGLIFDHDGTLVDSESTHYKIWHDIMLEYGVNFTEQEYILEHSGVPTLQNAEILTTTYSINVSAHALCKQKETRTDAYFSKHATTLMPHAQTCIEACLDNGLKLAIATGASTTEIQLSLSKRSFYPHFTGIATRNDVARTKPAPDVYELALQCLNMKAEQCWAIEDSPSGIASAKAAGLTCIAIPNQYSRHQDLSAADYHLEHLGQLLDLLASVESR